jgi:hypothetical protein
MALLTPTRRLLRALLILAVVFGVAPRPVNAQSPQPYPEYAVKAVFLYNFCQFTTWPQSSFSSPKAAITIGILGTDPFGSLIEEAVAGEVVGGRTIRIIRLRGVEEARQCHVVFLPRTAMGNVNALLNTVRGQSILTVGETDDFLKAGGMVSLSTEQGKVRLRINPQAVRGAALLLSSKLLRVANR